MKKLAIALAALLFIALIPPSVRASEGAHDGDTHEVAVHIQAGGVASGPGGRIRLEAEAQGSDTEGHWFVRQLYQGKMIEEHARVTCVTVVGHTAMIGIQFTHSTNPTRPVGAWTFLWMQDNGGNGADLWDVAGNSFGPPPTVCPSPPQPGSSFPGRITIRTDD